MKILITGSEGFIGRHVSKIAISRGHEVDGLDRELGLSMNDVPEPIFSKYNAVVHLAASIDITESLEDPWKYVEDNILALKPLRNAKRVVFASSAAVYGDFSPYGYSKRLGEELLTENSISLRLFNPFGPGEHHRAENHLVPRLAQSTEDTPATLYGNGQQVRDFIYVEDVAMAFILAAESDAVGAFDLCSTPLTIKEVADLMQVPYVLKDDKRDTADVKVLSGDASKLKDAIGFTPTSDVREKLKNWRNWYNRDI